MPYPRFVVPILAAVSLAAVSLAVAGCSGKPTEAECERFADHFIELMTKDQDGPAAEIARTIAVGMRDDNKRLCLETGTKADIECGLAAQSLEALQTCGGGPAIK